MEQSKNMEKQPLIKGCFSPEEAREIITSIFQHKLYFHSISSWSIKERIGGDTSFHANRIKELTLSLDKLLEAIDLAKTKGQYLDISCDVNMNHTENLHE